MALLEEMYKPYFANIVFYGPEEYPGVHQLSHYRGYFSYLCISDAMNRYPDFDGYFFLHDDFIFNAWLLKTFDHSKIFVPEFLWLYESKGNPIDITRGSKALPEWCWWNSIWGCVPTTKAYKEIPEFYKAILANNWGKNRVVMACSDFVYIPAKYSNEFIELATIFGKYKTFLEIALPTIVGCLSSKKDWVWLKVHGTSTGTDATYHAAYKNFNLDSYFNHPVKLSRESNRIFVKKLFAEMLNA